MSRRSLLSTEQRTRLFAIPADRAEMARHYVLSAEDLALVRTKRRTVNRLGFAIQLCLLRYPGHGLGPGERPPEGMIAFVAEQLQRIAIRLCRLRAAGPDPERARRRTASRSRAAALQVGRLAGLPPGGRGHGMGHRSRRADRRAMLAHLRAANVLVPAATVLERIGLTHAFAPASEPSRRWRTA